MSCEIPPEVLEYLELVEGGKVRACKEQTALAAHVRRCFRKEDLVVDLRQLENYLGLAKYFPFGELFPWEKFLIWM